MRNKRGKKGGNKRKRRSKSTKPTKVRVLQDKCEALWKEVCKLRDGLECQVKKYYPDLQGHGRVIQVDHFITRSNKHLKFDPRNGTVVCNSCNASKHWVGNGAVALAIEAIVVEREGGDWVADAKALELSKIPQDEYSKVWWLEEQIKQLDSAARYYRRSTNAKA